jgi:hypothetical protein
VLQRWAGEGKKASERGPEGRGERREYVQVEERLEREKANENEEKDEEKEVN